MNEILVPGCTPTPLANYLKALGVLRLISSKYPDTRGYWSGDQFVLRTSLDGDGIEHFFMDEYEPTPVLAPWNSGSGFYFQERKSKEKDPETGKKKKLGIRDRPTAATKIVDSVINSTNTRLDAYRNALALCKKIVERLSLQEAPASGKQKDGLVLTLRASLPDNCLEWIDAALAITEDKTRFPPLLGTGGNDGNLDFTSNFMQRLTEVIPTTQSSMCDSSKNWLHTSLFGGSAPNLIKNNIGQFSPGHAGGINATTGFEASAAINPWDFVLMIEGAVSLAASTTRRNADDPYGALSYPFTVRTTSAGSGSLGEGDAATERTRGELWMPLWARAITFTELRALLAEGRVALGKKPARDALDFIRAVHRLGSYRGVERFQRYGLLKRFGKNHLATPLQRVEVTANPETRWLDDLDQQDWLSRYRRFAQGDIVASRFLTLRRRLEDALFDLSGHDPSAGDAQALLVLLGDIQCALAVSNKAQESVLPVPRLSDRWVQTADDGTPAFRIARALAGLHGFNDVPLPLRAQLFPVHPRWGSQWMTPEYIGKHAGKDQVCRVRIHTSRKGNLPDTLHALLARRLWLAAQLGMDYKPLCSPAGVMLSDITAFLNDDSMDPRIAQLLPGLCLCDVPRDVDHGAGEGVAPAAFALLKLCLTPDVTLRKQDLLGEHDQLPVSPGLLAQLAAGNTGNRAVRLAWRRLRSSGLTPLFTPDALPGLGHIDPRRAAAALLIPLRFGATRALADSVLMTPDTETEPA